VHSLSGSKQLTLQRLLLLLLLLLQVVPLRSGETYIALPEDSLEDSTAAGQNGNGSRGSWKSDMGVLSGEEVLDLLTDPCCEFLLTCNR